MYLILEMGKLQEIFLEFFFVGADSQRGGIGIYSQLGVPVSIASGGTGIYSQRWDVYVFVSSPPKAPGLTDAYGPKTKRGGGEKFKNENARRGAKRS